MHPFKPALNIRYETKAAQPSLHNRFCKPPRFELPRRQQEASSRRLLPAPSSLRTARRLRTRQRCCRSRETAPASSPFLAAV